MSNVLKMPARPPARLGFKRAQKRKQKGSAARRQLNLFDAPDRRAEAGRIIQMPGPKSLSAFEQAVLLDEQGLTEARDLYMRAIDEADCVADAYCNLGILEFLAEKTDLAFDCFTKSLREDPRHMESHYNLGNLYFEIGDLRLAREHYEMAARIAPDFPDVYFNLGLVHAINDDLQAAVDTLFRFKELVSDCDADRADELLANLNQSLALR